MSTQRGVPGVDVAGRAIRVVIRSVAISSSSPLRARRLADGLSSSVEGALAGGGPGTRGGRADRDADIAATAIAEAIHARVREAGG